MYDITAFGVRVDIHLIMRVAMIYDEYVKHENCRNAEIWLAQQLPCPIYREIGVTKLTK